MSYDVFLSHNRCQKPWVRLLYRFLKGCGLSVFFDEEDVAPGENIVDAIERGVARSRHILLILSPESLQSRWVAMETQLGLYEDPAAVQRKVIPILLEDVDMSSVRPAIRPVKWIDLTSSADRERELRFLLRHLNIAEADRLSTRALRPLLATTPRVQSSALQVAGYDQVVSWRWDGARLLGELIELDYLTTDALSHRDEGTVDQWGPVFMHHPDTWRLLVTESQQIAGYWHIAPLFSEEYSRAREGSLLDSQITLDKVRLFELPGVYDVYFVQVCLRSECRSLRNVQLLFESFFEVLEELSESGIFLREVCANAYTDAGKAICRSFDMLPVGKHLHHGTIHAAPIDTVLKHYIAERFPGLKRRYAEEGLFTPEGQRPPDEGR
jgi:hypothetical protein